ncbi:MAG: response regulator [Solirubrobacterales bacterium]
MSETVEANGTSSPGTVLVVDDQAIVRDVVVRYLERDGYRTLAAGDGHAALQLIEDHDGELSLVVLDLMLPGIDGLELCRMIREKSDLPVIMLTARSGQSDRIVGLELGADDYVGKPFSPRELTARVRNVIRRARPDKPTAPVESTEAVEFGDLHIDPVAHQATRSGRPLKLTSREFDLLLFLARNPSQVFSRDQLMARVWGFESALDTGTVSVHVRRLREKIESDPSEPKHLQTVWGMGYRFSLEGAA